MTRSTLFSKSCILHLTILFIVFSITSSVMGEEPDLEVADNNAITSNSGPTDRNELQQGHKEPDASDIENKPKTKDKSGLTGSISKKSQEEQKLIRRKLVNIVDEINILLSGEDADTLSYSPFIRIDNTFQEQKVQFINSLNELRKKLAIDYSIRLKAYPIVQSLRGINDLEKAEKVKTAIEQLTDTYDNLTFPENIMYAVRNDSHRLRIKWIEFLHKFQQGNFKEKIKKQVRAEEFLANFVTCNDLYRQYLLEKESCLAPLKENKKEDKKENDKKNSSETQLISARDKLVKCVCAHIQDGKPIPLFRQDSEILIDKDAELIVMTNVDEPYKVSLTTKSKPVVNLLNLVNSAFSGTQLQQQLEDIRLTIEDKESTTSQDKKQQQEDPKKKIDSLDKDIENNDKLLEKLKSVAADIGKGKDEAKTNETSQKNEKTEKKVDDVVDKINKQNVQKKKEKEDLKKSISKPFSRELHFRELPSIDTVRYMVQLDLEYNETNEMDTFFVANLGWRTNVSIPLVFLNRFNEFQHEGFNDHVATGVVISFGYTRKTPQPYPNWFCDGFVKYVNAGFHLLSLNFDPLDEENDDTEEDDTEDTETVSFPDFQLGLGISLELFEFMSFHYGYNCMIPLDQNPWYIGFGLNFKLFEKQ